MGMNRDVLERQLQHAKEALEARTKVLDESGTDAKQRRLDPKWRSLNAECRQLQRRLRAYQAIVDRDEELKNRKAQGAAAE